MNSRENETCGEEAATRQVEATPDTREQQNNGDEKDATENATADPQTDASTEAQRKSAEKNIEVDMNQQAIFWMQLGNTMVPLVHAQLSGWTPGMLAGDPAIPVPESLRFPFAQNFPKPSDHGAPSSTAPAASLPGINLPPPHQFVSTKVPQLLSQQLSAWPPINKPAVTISPLPGQTHFLPGQLANAPNAEHQAQIDKGNERVTIWNPTERRKLSGNAAPFRRNLQEYLSLHPEWELYVSQDAGLRKRKRAVVGPISPTNLPASISGDQSQPHVADVAMTKHFGEVPTGAALRSLLIAMNENNQAHGNQTNLSRLAQEEARTG